MAGATKNLRRFSPCSTVAAGTAGRAWQRPPTPFCLDSQRPVQSAIIELVYKALGIKDLRAIGGLKIFSRAPTFVHQRPAVGTDSVKRNCIPKKTHTNQTLA